MEKKLKKAIFLDRDGTIIEDTGHISTLDAVEFFNFSFDALRMLQKEYLLFIVTNQSGVGLQKITREAAEQINAHVLSTLQSNGIAIEQLYCCSHKRDDNCECIKPKPFFIHKALQEYPIDIGLSYTIGDHPHDVAFGANAGAKGLYVLTGHGKKHLADVNPGTDCFGNLLDAARWILKNSAALS